MTEPLPRKLESLTRPADPEVVKLIEELLAMAKRGEVSGIVYACSDHSGYTQQGYAGRVWGARVLGAIEILKHVIIRDAVLE